MQKDLYVIYLVPHTILKLIKCNVLVAEIVNENEGKNFIVATKEVIGGHDSYTYKTKTAEEIELVITFDRYTFLEITEEN